VLHLAPRRARLLSLLGEEGSGASRRERDLGLVRLLGWQSGLVAERWASAALVAQLKGHGLHGGAEAQLTFDRELLGFTYHLVKPGPALQDLPPAAMGVHHSGMRMLAERINDWSS